TLSSTDPTRRKTMEKIGRSGRFGDQRVIANQPYQTDKNGRALTRNQGLDPGDDPTLNEMADGFVGKDAPTLDQFTRRMDHPPIADVGRPQNVPHFVPIGNRASKARP